MQKGEKNKFNYGNLNGDQVDDVIHAKDRKLQRNLVQPQWNKDHITIDSNQQWRIIHNDKKLMLFFN